MHIFEDRTIAGLDLDPIKRKLMRDKPGLAWSRERADAAEKGYRKFLFLMKMFPNELAAPSMDVDRFWNHHIVDTAKYARDCEAVFGYFLHRYPYLGMGGDEQAAYRLQAGARMRELSRQVFGEQHGAPDAESLDATGFAIAVQSPAQFQAPHTPWTTSDVSDEPDEPDEPEDLLDQIRFVVIENQRYDRVAEPVM